MTNIGYDLSRNALVATNFVETASASNAILMKTGSEGSTIQASEFVESTSLLITGWKYGLVCTDTIGSSGGSLTIFDSWNSSLGDYGGTNTGSNFYMICASNSSGSISLATQAKVYGNVGGREGTNQSLISFASSASVGDTAWIASNLGMQPGHFITTSFQETIPSSSNELYLPSSVFNRVSIPFTSGLPFPSFALTGSITQSGDYFGTSLNLGGGKTLEISASCRIYFTGNFVTGGTGKMLIAPSCSVKLYSGGTISISNTTGIQNLSKIPQNLILYNLGTSNVGFSTLAPLYGCIESQGSTVIMSALDIYGYVIAKSISKGSGGGIHMDEATTRDLGITQFTMTPSGSLKAFGFIEG